MTDHPGEQFPPAVDPDVEPGYDPEPDEQSRPDYDTEPGPESHTPWVNPTLQGRPHTDPLLAGFTVYGDPTPEPDPVEDTEQAFEASLEEPTQHSFVDDGPDDSYSEPEQESEPEQVQEHHAPPAAEYSPRPPAPSPGQGYPRPAAPSSARGLPGPDAVVEESASRPGVPGQGFARPASPVPGQGFARAGSPVPSAPAAAPAPVVPGPSAPAAAVPAVARPSAPAAGAEERGEDEVHPLVEVVMERLDGLGELAVAEHAEVYAELHERLQSALVEADAEHGDRG